MNDSALNGYLERAIMTLNQKQKFQRSYYVLDKEAKTLTNFPEQTITRKGKGGDRFVGDDKFVIDLSQASGIEKSSATGFRITMNSGFTHRMRCATEQDCLLWFNAIEKVISGTPEPEEPKSATVSRSGSKISQNFPPALASGRTLMSTLQRKKKERRQKNSKSADRTQQKSIFGDTSIEELNFNQLSMSTSGKSRNLRGLKAIKSKRAMPTQKSNFMKVDLSVIPPPPSMPNPNWAPPPSDPPPPPDEEDLGPPPPPPSERDGPRSNFHRSMRSTKPTVVFNPNRLTLSFPKSMKPATGGDLIGASARKWSYVQDGKSASVQTLREVGVRKAVRPQTTIISNMLQKITSKPEQTYQLLFDTLSQSDSLAHMLFKGLDDIAVKQMVDSMYQVAARKGEDIITHGLQNNKFYVVGDGKVFVYIYETKPSVNQVTICFGNNSDESLSVGEEVVEKEKGAKRKTIYANEKVNADTVADKNAVLIPKFVNRLGRGGFFGELSLLYEDVSSVTIKAAEPCILWAIDREEFHRISTEASERGRVHKLGYLTQMNGELLNSWLPANQLDGLTEAAEYKQYKKYDVILAKGDQIRKMFWVTRGEVYVFSSPPRVKISKDHALNVFGEGAAFGETALFEKSISEYHFVSSGDVQLLELDVVEAEEIVGSLQDVLKRKLNDSSSARKNGVRNIITDASAFEDSATDELKNALVSIKQHMDSRVTSLMSVNPNATNNQTTFHYGDRFSNQSVRHTYMNPIDVPFMNVPPLIKNMKFDILTPKAHLGSGSFGNVHLMKNSSPQGFVLSALGMNQTISPTFFALKVLGRNAMTEKGWQVMITNERMAWSEVSYLAKSPFVVQLYHTFADAKNVYLVVEACTGGDLYRLVKNMPRKRFDTEWHAQFFLANTILGLEAVHSKSIIFRDLKPENLLISKSGYLKITDFGLAKKSLRTFTICGTADYIAPEIILRKGHDFAVDFWALGVLLFELTTGMAPFTGKDNPETHENVCNHVPGRFKVLEKKKIEITHDRKRYDQYQVGRRSTIMNQTNRNRGTTNSTAIVNITDEVFEEDNEPESLVYIPAGAFDLVNRLMDPKKTKRLGCLASGFDGLKRHGYFKDFNWRECEEQRLQVPLTPLSNEDAFNDDNVCYNPRFDAVPDDSSTWVPNVDTFLARTPTYDFASDEEEDY